MDVKIILKEAKDAINNKDFKKALEICTDGLDFHNMNFNLHLFIGLCNFNLNKFKESEEAYKNALSITPSSPFPLRGLMDLYQKSGESDKYIKVIKELIPHTTDSIKKRELQTKMVDHYMTNQQFKDAIEMINDILESIKQQQQLGSDDTNNHSERLKMMVKLESLLYQQRQQQFKDLFEAAMKEKNIPILNPAKAKVIGAPTHTPQQAQEKILIERKVYQKVLVNDNIKLYKEILESNDLLSLIEIKQVEKIYQNYIEYFIQKRYSIIGDDLESEQKRQELKSTIHHECIQMNRLLLYPYFPLETIISLLEENGQAMNDVSILGISQMLTRMHPDRGLGWIGLGYYQVFHQNDLSDNTRAMLENGLNQTPNSLLGNVALGKIYLHQQNHQRLKEVVRRGIDSCSSKEKESGKYYDSYHIEFHLYLAESLLIQFETENAVLVLEEVLKKHPGNTKTTFTLAKLYFDNQKYSQSLSLFQSIVDKVDANNQDIHNISKSMVIWIELEQHDKKLGNIKKEIKDSINDLLQKDDGYLNHYLLGLYYRLIGENDSAIQEFLKSAQRNPNYALTFSNLGLLYKEKRDMERSKKCFQKALSLDILNVDAGLQLSSIYIANEQYTLASSLYQDITARCLESRKQLNANITKCSWAFYRLALYQMDVGQLDNSCSNFLMALKGNPNDEQYWRGIGECYRRQIKYIASLKALKRAEELLNESNSTAPDLNYQIASLNMILGEYKDAVVEFKLVLESLPNHLPSFKGMADCYFQLAMDYHKSNYQRLAYQSLTYAEDSCLKAIESSKQQSGNEFESVWKLYGDISSYYHYLAPSSNEEEEGRGEINYISKLEQAATAYLKCIEIQPLNYNSLYDLSLTYYYQYIRIFELKQSTKETHERLDTLFKSAVKCITQAINHSPRQARYWNLLGVILIDKYPMQSQHAFIKSIQIDSSKSNPYNNLAMLYLQNNNIDLSNSSLFISKSNDATFIASWSIQALIHELKNDSSQSYSEYSHIEIALESNPTGEGLLSNGILSYYNGNIDRAELLLSKYVKQYDDSIDAHNHLGLVYEQLGQFEISLKHFSRALELVVERDGDVTIDSIDITLSSLSLSNNQSISFAIQRNQEQQQEQSLIVHDSFKKFITINVARVQCKLGYYKECLSTLEPYTKEKSTSPSSKSSHILEIVALANYHLGNCDQSMEYLKLAIANVKPDIINDEHACKQRKVQLLLSMSTICFNNNRLKQCEQIIEKVIENDPTLENAYHLLASIYILSKEYTKATETINRLHNQTLHPTLHGLLILAKCHILGEKYDRARAVLLNACHCFPDQTSAWLALAQFLNNYSNNDITSSNIRQIIYQQIEIQQQSLESINSDTLTQYQVEHIRLLEQLSSSYLYEVSRPYSENIEQSISATKKIIHIDPNQVEPWKNLSTLYYIRALHLSDQESYENALILNQLVKTMKPSSTLSEEDSFQLDYELGDIYLYKASTTTTTTDSEKEELKFNQHHSSMVQKYKDHTIFISQFQRQLGTFNRLVKKDYKKSIECYKNSILSNPLNIISFQELSYVYEELKYYEASYHCLAKALSICQNKFKESNGIMKKEYQNHYLIIVCRSVRYLLMSNQLSAASKILDDYIHANKHQQQHPIILLFKSIIILINSQEKKPSKQLENELNSALNNLSQSLSINSKIPLANYYIHLITIKLKPRSSTQPSSQPQSKSPTLNSSTDSSNPPPQIDHSRFIRNELLITPKLQIK